MAKQTTEETRRIIQAWFDDIGKTYEILDAHRLELNDEGLIKSWRVFFDPEPEVEAYEA